MNYAQILPAIHILPEAGRNQTISKPTGNAGRPGTDHFENLHFLHHRIEKSNDWSIRRVSTRYLQNKMNRFIMRQSFRIALYAAENLLNCCVEEVLTFTNITSSITSNEC